MKIKKGDVFYEPWINLDITIGEKSSIEVDQWHVTNIDKRGVFFREKTRLTWGKLSSAHGDYGWLPQTTWTRENSFKKCSHEELESKIKDWNFHKSKAAAYRSLMPDIKKAKRDVLRLYASIEKKIEKHTKKKSK